MSFIFLILGFLLLIKGADFFVEGSSSLAKILKIPSVIIGLTIVAMGTSAPEASVSLNAALAGNNDIAVSNVIGSNIFNGLIVVGVCAFMKTFVIDKTIIKRDLPVNLGISIILVIMLLDLRLNILEGLILCLGFITYIGIMIFSAMKNRECGEVVKSLSLPKSILYIIFGLAAVIWGGNLVVNHASHIATMLGLSQSFIGLTIVAVGTSLPELVTSIVATKKGDSGLALGNAVGSNIFNILFILGMSAAISPLTIVSKSIIDGIVMIGMSLILMIIGFVNGKMSRKAGIICIIIYLLYLGYLIAGI